MIKALASQLDRALFTFCSTHWIPSFLKSIQVTATKNIIQGRLLNVNQKSILKLADNIREDILVLTIQQLHANDAYILCRMGAQHQHIKLFKAAIGTNSDRVLRGKQDFLSSPMHYIARHGNIEMANVALRYSSAQNREYLLQIIKANLSTPLHIACLFGKNDFVSYVLDQLGPSALAALKKFNHLNRTPLQVAAASGHTKICHRILEEFPSNDRANEILSTANGAINCLQLTAVTGDSDSFRSLLEVPGVKEKLKENKGERAQAMLSRLINLPSRYLTKQASVTRGVKLLVDFMQKNDIHCLDVPAITENLTLNESAITKHATTVDDLEDATRLPSTVAALIFSNIVPAELTSDCAFTSEKLAANRLRTA